jgi:hypothetical protein
MLDTFCRVFFIRKSLAYKQKRAIKLLLLPRTNFAQARSANKQKQCKVSAGLAKLE